MECHTVRLNSASYGFHNFVSNINSTKWTLKIAQPSNTLILITDRWALYIILFSWTLTFQDESSSGLEDMERIQNFTIWTLTMALVWHHEKVSSAYCVGKRNICKKKSFLKNLPAVQNIWKNHWNVDSAHRDKVNIWHKFHEKPTRGLGNMWQP